ncbi:DUF1552 domain-containing protein [Calycomorphotria hydatis]|uniref:DUF1552 domain-containing protein n=1 Tax=Calycomorphotria hydatis TaxID=2528027 RepID=A0A517T936_9PLAN|nr:DUF1552 domain-containing protein [Calycomorphotria hydatis]QDT64895.1 hypothetical protein V22_21380 [Calycomorphotria hydatis]
MSNYNTNRWLLDRRHVLRGLGATIALPLLDCMKPVMAAQGETIQPKRSVFIYIPNGVEALSWQIQKAGADYELTKPMSSLERHRAEITPISGLHHPDAIGKHHYCEKVWLTGADVPADGGPFRNSISVDQMIAEKLGVYTRFPSLEIAITGGSLAWSREGIQLPAEKRPRTIFNRLFGIEPGGTEAARRTLNRRTSVLDVVIDDANSLRRKIGTEDQTKLDEYLTAVREVEVRTQRAEGWLDVPKPEVEDRLKAYFDREIAYTAAGDYYRTIYDLMVLALRTDMTRVITCMTGSENFGLSIPEIGIAQSRHELSHHNGDPEQMRRLTTTDTFLVEQFSYFLDQLKTHSDGDQPLLDTTQVLWGSGMAYGHSHGTANLPLILAGGKALGAQHGTHVDFNLPVIGEYNMETASKHYGLCSKPVDGDARLSNLFLTMLHRSGVKADAFHDSMTTYSDKL